MMGWLARTSLSAIEPHAARESKLRHSPPLWDVLPSIVNSHDSIIHEHQSSTRLSPSSES